MYGFSLDHFVSQSSPYFSEYSCKRDNVFLRMYLNTFFNGFDNDDISVVMGIRDT